MVGQDTEDPSLITRLLTSPNSQLDNTTLLSGVRSAANGSGSSPGVGSGKGLEDLGVDNAGSSG